MTPSHYLFRNLFAIASETLATYDYLPDSSASYPFAFVGDNSTATPLTHDNFGTIRQTDHFYGPKLHRSELDAN